MTETDTTIRQLRAADFEEAMEVMNHAFFAGTSKDFRQTLPKLYRATDELMSCHYAAVCDGGIKAVVGLYPLDLCIDGVPLRVARGGIREGAALDAA